MLVCSETTRDVLCMELVAIDKACNILVPMEAEDVDIIRHHVRNMRDILMSPCDFKHVTSSQKGYTYE